MNKHTFPISSIMGALATELDVRPSSIVGDHRIELVAEGK